MIKDDEIKLLEDISSKIIKLFKAKDSYVKTFLSPFLEKDVESDINKMCSNIKSDFPIMMGTKLERIYGHYMWKSKNYQQIIEKLNKKYKTWDVLHICEVESLHASIEDLSQILQKMTEHDDELLNKLLGSLESLNIDFTKDSIEELIYSSYIHDIIINTKIDLKLPLSNFDHERIKFLLELNH
jgi:F0F1-type ATP synthase delta subunit